jgi:DHA1 family tetracycline resistance protein-like MFS transporter
MQTNILWIFLFVFIDVLGFSLILPLLPYVGEEFHVRPTIMGLALTSNAISQMIAGLIIDI